jgi:hypothetical protein
MAGPCGRATMKAFIAASDDQLVPVQKVPWRSRSTLTARLPSARAACHALRRACTRKAGRNVQERTRSRVMETSGMRSPFLATPALMLPVST